jgi:hypothetical protein
MIPRNGFYDFRILDVSGETEGDIFWYEGECAIIPSKHYR